MCVYIYINTHVWGWGGVGWGGRARFGRAIRYAYLNTNADISAHIRLSEVTNRLRGAHEPPPRPGDNQNVAIAASRATSPSTSARITTISRAISADRAAYSAKINQTGSREASLGRVRNGPPTGRLTAPLKWSVTAKIAHVHVHVHVWTDVSRWHVCSICSWTMYLDFFFFLSWYRIRSRWKFSGRFWKGIATHMLTYYICGNLIVLVWFLLRL